MELRVGPRMSKDEQGAGSRSGRSLVDSGPAGIEPRTFSSPNVCDGELGLQADLDHIAWELNGRPRQTLSFKTPSEALNEVLR
jgi:hypothetical protein